MIEDAVKAFSVKATSLETDEEKSSVSAEICAAIVDRHHSLKIKGYLIPRLNQPSINVASLLESGLMSPDDARKLIHEFSGHEYEMKKLIKALEVNNLIEAQGPPVEE